MKSLDWDENSPKFVPKYPVENEPASWALGSGNSVVPPGNKSLPETVLIKINQSSKSLYGITRPQ